MERLEKGGGCNIYPPLKRRYEKYVTEKSFESPKFVEDVLRDAIISSRSYTNVLWYELECENSAYAYQCEWQQNWENQA